MSNQLESLVHQYGSDKALSGYTNTYAELFEPLRNKVSSVLEIGIGTLDPNIPSSFCGITGHYEHYKPGGSLRTWRDFFPNAEVYGIDIAEDCMFEEERIQTFLFDSSDESKCETHLSDRTFDVIIDDGNHDPKYQIKTLKNLLPRLTSLGYYIIEDIGGYSGTEQLLSDYLEDFNVITQGYEIDNRGNHVIIYRMRKEKNEEERGLDMTSEALHYIGRNIKSAFIVQIGAMDGINFDDTRGFLDMYKWPALLVEPIPEIFNELVTNFKDRSNYLFEQSAITEEDGEVEMITIPLETIERVGLHPGYKGMSALYPLKNGFGSDYQRDIDVKNEHAINIKVPSITLKSLLEKHEVSKIDAFICDAEGYDWNIFKQLNLKKFRPLFIRLEYMNLTEEEKELTRKKLIENDYRYIIRGQDIDAFEPSVYDNIPKTEVVTSELKPNSNLTIVSGLWNIGRTGRDFEEHYIPRFKEFLQIPHPMILFLPEELHDVVWGIRKKRNTQIIKYELEDIKNLYAPFWDQTQRIRTSENWLNITGEGGWLKSSPQALLEWYNPIVQSKMFLLHDASIFNTFNTDYHFWLDAGITNTVPATHLIENDCLKGITKYSDPFLFLSYPYESAGEIHGFDVKELNRIAGEEVNYVCRGGFFGGRKEQISQANATYYGLLINTLDGGHMGTEESIFLLMAYLYPHSYKRYMLDGNGLIVKFTEALINNNVELEVVSEKKKTPVKIISDRDVEKVKTNLYVLTFNFPDQLRMLMSFFERSPEWLTEPRKILIDNSTKKKAIKANKKIAKEYGFEYIGSKKNLGINGGRQKAAEHFHKSNADYMFFFEDDMTLNTSEETGFCRNGFRKYIPNLYNRIHKVIKREEYDFVKLSFTEVFMDNNIQCSWYNVPQHIREEFWPDYNKLPVTGLDPNAPLTKFNNIKVYDELSYADGEIYYCNWPMIVSKEGNRKMFIETTWAHPFEQTYMSHIYQLTKKGKIKPAVLLLSPITHDRQHHYKPDERRES